MGEGDEGDGEYRTSAGNSGGGGVRGCAASGGGEGGVGDETRATHGGGGEQHDGVIAGCGPVEQQAIVKHAPE